MIVIREKALKHVFSGKHDYTPAAAALQHKPGSVSTLSCTVSARRRPIRFQHGRSEPQDEDIGIGIISSQPIVGRGGATVGLQIRVMPDYRYSPASPG